MTRLTRQNIDAAIDARLIEADVNAYRKGGATATPQWWTILRIGKTWRGKRDPARIRLPFRSGFDVYGTITEEHFLSDGSLNPTKFRMKQE